MVVTEKSLPVSSLRKIIKQKNIKIRRHICIVLRKSKKKIKLNLTIFCFFLQ